MTHSPSRVLVSDTLTSLRDGVSETRTRRNSHHPLKRPETLQRPEEGAYVHTPQVQQRCRTQSRIPQEIPAGPRRPRRRQGFPACAAIPAMPSYPRWNARLTNASQLLKDARDEMQAYAQERSEQWQESEKAERLTANKEAIEEALDALDSFTCAG